MQRELTMSVRAQPQIKRASAFNANRHRLKESPLETHCFFRRNSGQLILLRAVGASLFLSGSVPLISYRPVLSPLYAFALKSEKNRNLGDIGVLGLTERPEDQGFRTKDDACQGSS
jgi:hypothetical protein